MAGTNLRLTFGSKFSSPFKSNENNKQICSLLSLKPELFQFLLFEYFCQARTTKHSTVDFKDACSILSSLYMGCYSNLSLVSAANEALAPTKKQFQSNIHKKSKDSKMCLFFLQPQWLPSYQQFCDFSLNKVAKPIWYQAATWWQKLADDFFSLMDAAPHLIVFGGLGQACPRHSTRSTDYLTNRLLIFWFVHKLFVIT